MRVNTDLNTYTQVTQVQWLQDKLAFSKAVLEEQQAQFAGISHHKLKGLPPSIDPDQLPKNYKDAMSRAELQAWDEAYHKEYCRFKERNAFKIIYPEQGIKIHNTLTRLEYKEDKGTLFKQKSTLVCKRGPAGGG